MKVVERRSFGQRVGIVAFVGTLFVVMLAGVGPRHAASEALLPHGFCYSWDPGLVRLHVVSDALIGLAYTAIPIALLVFIRRRTDLPFNWMFLLFGLFIVACGATHWMEVWTLWHPVYWWSGAVKAITAAASVPTAILLFFLIPKALALPSTRQLQEAKAALEREVIERRRAEQELRNAHDVLESRVQARTRDLMVANERLEAQRRQLEDANRKKSEFLAIVSHELRNPVHAISASAQYVAIAASEPSLKESAAVIERQVDQMSRLLDDLLEVVRGEYRPGQFDLGAMAVREIIRSAVDNVLPLLQKKGQRLETSFDDGSIPVRVDPRRICQALTNILRNASFYSSDGQTISIRVDASDAEVRVAITDQGIGLEPSERAGLFDLFTRGERARRKSATGLGIGLHVARQIIQAHGGTIEATSEGPGKGTTFCVTLPVAP